jgi:hypothetical protein
MNSYWTTDGPVHQTYVVQPDAGCVVPRDVSANVPAYADVATQLPALHWPARPDVESVASLAWKLTWEHLHDGRPGQPLSAPFLDAAFNGCVFLWDATFSARLTTYARRVLDIDTLRGFYETQWADGWICRTIDVEGRPKWDPHNPSSSGPNVLAWTELVLAERSGDYDRLAEILPALVAYHRWTRRNRTWPDGSYWSSGWGCGMDGLPRLPDGVDPNFEHGWTAWVDATLQALLSAQCLVRMAQLTGSDADHADLVEEIDRLMHYLETTMWDDELGAYTDRWPGGKSAGVLHVGTYWALLAGLGDGGRADRMVDHLLDPARFGRRVPVPALAADQSGYRSDGGYWRGGVWTPTTVMVLDGLQHTGRGALAHALGLRHVDEVAATATRTGTLWENYSPDDGGSGFDARPDFCGWAGASAFTIPLEHVMGLRVVDDVVHWDVRLPDEHGALRLPVGRDVTADMVVSARTSADETPQLRATSDAAFELVLTWGEGQSCRRRVRINGGSVAEL